MLSIRQLIEASIAANRDLTLVTSSSAKAEEIARGIHFTYSVSRLQLMRRGEWLIDSITVRIHVADHISQVNNVWYV